MYLIEIYFGVLLLKLSFIRNPEPSLDFSNLVWKVIAKAPSVSSNDGSVKVSQILETCMDYFVLPGRSCE